MRAFFRGIIWIILILVATPFIAGFIIQLGVGVDYYLAVVSASLFFISLFFLIRGRIQGLFIMFLSVIALLYSKHQIHFNGFNGVFLNPYGMASPFEIFIIILLVVFIVLFLRRN